MSKGLPSLSGGRDQLHQARAMGGLARVPQGASGPPSSCVEPAGLWGRCTGLGAMVGASLFFIWGEDRGMSRSWARGMA